MENKDLAITCRRFLGAVGTAMAAVLATACSGSSSSTPSTGSAATTPSTGTSATASTTTQTSQPASQTNASSGGMITLRLHSRTGA